MQTGQPGAAAGWAGLNRLHCRLPRSAAAQLNTPLDTPTQIPQHTHSQGV